MDISRESRSQAPVRRSTTQQRHLLRFPYTAICRQKKTSTLDPSGAGSHSLRISLPKRFSPLIGAHVALLNGSQIVRNRRCWVCSKLFYNFRSSTIFVGISLGRGSSDSKKGWRLLGFRCALGLGIVGDHHNESLRRALS